MAILSDYERTGGTHPYSRPVAELRIRRSRQAASIRTMSNDG